MPDRTDAAPDRPTTRRAVLGRVAGLAAVTGALGVPGAAAAATKKSAQRFTMIGKGRRVFTVVVEFNVTPEQQAELKTELPKILVIVARQPGFISANLHCSQDGAKALGYQQWQSAEAFAAYRANEAVQKEVGPVFAKFGAMPRSYEIVFSTFARR